MDLEAAFALFSSEIDELETKLPASTQSQPQSSTSTATTTTSTAPTTATTNGTTTSATSTTSTGSAKKRKHDVISSTSSASSSSSTSTFASSTSSSSASSFVISAKPVPVIPVPEYAPSSVGPTVSAHPSNMPTPAPLAPGTMPQRDHIPLPGVVPQLPPMPIPGEQPQVPVVPDDLAARDAAAAAAAAAEKAAKQEPPKKKPKKHLRTVAGQVWEDKTLDEWPENDFRIFVGDLGPEVNDQALTKLFSAYPSFVKAKVVRDSKYQRSKGYAFVSYMDPTEGTKAMRELNGKYCGNRPLKLRKSEWHKRELKPGKPVKKYR